MQKKEVKKVLVCIVSIVMLALTITTSFATDTVNNFNGLRPGNNEAVTKGNNMNYSAIEDGAGNKIPEKTNNAVPGNKAENKIVNNAVNNSQGLPYTGTEYTGVLAIGVCIIVAVYSYIKVKKYNV